MAQSDGRCRDLFNNGHIRIHKNHCDEIFIENASGRVQMRISPSGDGLEFTTFGGGRVQPRVAAGSIGWEVVPR